MHSDLFGMIPFVAPELLLAADKKNNKPIKPIPYNKSSDIYSLGMLLWEISSGYPPFKDNETKFLANNIINGMRENRMLNMPNDYYNLYESCWNANSEKRPIIEKVFEDLEIIYKETKNGSIILKCK
jgi:serine/threonine protein kinase